jgi:hypothetical protein
MSIEGDPIRRSIAVRGIQTIESERT